MKSEMAEAEYLLAKLIQGIKKWAAEEDGVPEWMWEDFCAACRLLGEKV